MGKPICAVCYDDLSIGLRDGDKRPVCAIGCGHVFHFSCISRWLAERQVGTCPQCMTRLTDRHLQRLLIEMEGASAAGGGGGGAAATSGGAAARATNGDDTAVSSSNADDDGESARPWKARCVTLEKRTKDLEDENQTLRLLLEEAEQGHNRSPSSRMGGASAADGATSLSDSARSSAALNGSIAAFLNRHPPSHAGFGRSHSRPTGSFEEHFDPWSPMTQQAEFEGARFGHRGRRIASDGDGPSGAAAAASANNPNSHGRHGRVSPDDYHDFSGDWSRYFSSSGHGEHSSGQGPTRSPPLAAQSSEPAAVDDSTLDSLLADRNGSTTPPHQHMPSFSWSPMNWHDDFPFEWVRSVERSTAPPPAFMHASGRHGPSSHPRFHHQQQNGGRRHGGGAHGDGYPPTNNGGGGSGGRDHQQAPPMMHRNQQQPQPNSFLRWFNNHGRNHTNF